MREGTFYKLFSIEKWPLPVDLLIYKVGYLSILLADVTPDFFSRSPEKEHNLRNP